MSIEKTSTVVLLGLLVGGMFMEKSQKPLTIEDVLSTSTVEHVETMLDTPVLRPARKASISASELTCMAENIYHEARGEPVSGQKAVVAVVLNRVKDKRWPSTICEVVWQKYQFSWTLEKEVSDERIKASKKEYTELRNRISSWLNEGLDVKFKNANHYARVEVKRYWMKRLKPLGAIGDHKFFTDK